MSQSLFSVAVFLALMVCLPFAVKWIKTRTQGDVRQVGGHSKLISAIAVGPQQRVVTVEVGPHGARVWLTLGVTAQTITCLHTGPIELDKATELGGAGVQIASI